MFPREPVGLQPLEVEHRLAVPDHLPGEPREPIDGLLRCIAAADAATPEHLVHVRPEQVVTSLFQGATQLRL